MEGSNTFTFTLNDDAIDSDVLSDGAASYMQGAGGLIGETRGGTSKYYHADALGTTRAITNSTQTKTDSLDTDAFGMNIASTGSTPTPFGFAGQHGYQNDSVTGLMRLGHRFYDASVGRFLSRDPIQDGDNWYAYCNNDPVNKIDPTGLIIPKTPPPSRHVTDQEGYPVIIGGNPLNHHGNAMTYGGVTYIHDEDDWDLYRKSPKWRAHEHWHVHQEWEMGEPWFLIEIIKEYITVGHDLAPLERDADDHAGISR